MRTAGRQGPGSRRCRAGRSDDGMTPSRTRRANRPGELALPAPESGRPSDPRQDEIGPSAAAGRGGGRGGGRWWSPRTARRGSRTASGRTARLPQRAGRRDLTWWPRSGPSPPRPRARATTSATATTRRTTPRTRTPAPGPARARKSSGSKAPSTRTRSRRCSKARCRTAPTPGSGGAARTGASSTAPAATSPSRPRNPSRWPRWSAAMRAWSTAHDRAVARTLDWFERNVAETRMKDPETGRMVRTGGQKTVIATFRHDTSRNLDPALHTHAVIANMVQGGDGKWRSMANERLYESKMLLGALYRSELAQGLARLGYGIEKTHADGRFEIAGVSREVVEAFSTRRAEIEAAVAERGGGETADNQRLAQRAALMTRAAKRDVDREALRESWERQAAGSGSTRRRWRGSRSPGMPERDAGTERAWKRAAGPDAAGEATARAAGRDAAARDMPAADGGTAGTVCRTRSVPWRPRRKRNVRVRHRGRGRRRMGGGAPLGARGRVRAHRPARGRARLEPGRGVHRRRRARGRGAREGGHAARRPPAGRRGAAHHRPRGRRRARDRRADAGGRAARRRPDARPRRRQGAQERPPHPGRRRR